MTICYFYRGLIERNYRLVEGYSRATRDGHPVYPWLSRPECWEQAQREDGVAVFYGAPVDMCRDDE